MRSHHTDVRRPDSASGICSDHNRRRYGSQRYRCRPGGRDGTRGNLPRGRHLLVDAQRWHSSACVRLAPQITLSSQTLKCVTAADGQAGTGQTSRILLGGQANNWVEVGALTQYCPSGSQCNRAFFEYAVVGTYNYQQRYAFSCLNPGTRHTWSIERKQLGGTWAGYLSCYTSQPFVQVDSTTPNLGYNTGFAEGEGFERGFSNTYWGDEAPMAETHSVMQYQNAYQGAWLASGDLSCRLDDSLRWDGSWLASDSFQIVENHRGTGC